MAVYMSEPLTVDLELLATILDTGFPRPSKGSTAEVDDNGIVTIRRSNGSAIMAMPLDVYQDLLKWQGYREPR